MRNKPRRIVALLLTMSIIILNVFGCGKEDTNKAEDTNSHVSITRGEWIESLSKGFGMDEFTNTTPYYSDVNENSEIYKYVQSCYEWDVLSTGTDKFKPDDVATLGFVISTAVLAADLDYSKYETDDLNTAIIMCAKDNNIYDIEPDSKELLSSVTAVEASVILQAAMNSYFVMDDTQEKCDMGYKDGVEMLPEDKKLDIPITGNSVVEETIANEYSEGDVFVVQASPEYPNGAAFKVVSKTLNADGTYTIETAIPEIWEVFDEIDVNKMEMADPSTFVPEDGVTVIDNTSAYNNITNNVMAVDRYSVSSLDDINGVINETKVKSFESEASQTLSLSVEFGDEGLSANTDYSTKLGELESKIGSSVESDENLEEFKEVLKRSGTLPSGAKFEIKVPGLEEYKNGKIDLDKLTEELEKKKKESKKEELKTGSKWKWKEGYKITGTVNLKAGVKVQADINFKFLSVKLKKFSVDVFDDVSTEIKIEGSIKGEKKLGKYNIPIGAGFSIGLKVSVVVEFDGSLSYKYEIESTNGITYEDGKWKKTHTETTSHTFEAGVSAEIGLKGAITIDILCFSLAEASLQISAKGVAKTTLTDSFGYEIDKTNKKLTINKGLKLENKVDIYAPLVTIEIGGDDTLLGVIGVEAKFELLNEDNAPKFSVLDDSVEIKLTSIEIDLKDEDETTTEEETTTKQEETTTDNSNQTPSISLSAYVVSLSAGESQQIIPTLPDGYAESDLTWTTSDSSVATVSNGVIKGVSEGSAIVTVTTKDGSYKGQCNVLVD